MASLNVSMPDELREFIDKRTNQGGFSTPSEYVRHLVREDKKRETIEGKLLQALDEGGLRDLERDFFNRLRARLPKTEKSPSGRDGDTTTTSALSKSRARRR